VLASTNGEFSKLTPFPLKSLTNIRVFGLYFFIWEVGFEGFLQEKASMQINANLDSNLERLIGGL